MKDNKEELTKYFVDNLRLSNTINKIKKPKVYNSIW